MYWRYFPLAFFCLLLSMSAGQSLQADPAKEPRSDLRGTGVPVTTGLVSLPERHTYRLMLVKVGKDEVPIRAQVQLIDQHGEVVAQQVQTLRGSRAAVLDLHRVDIQRADAVQLRARLLLQPLGPNVGDDACPLTLTVQTLEADHDDGPFEMCGVNPCCPGCVPGGGGFPGVQFNCGTSNPILVGP